MSAIDALFQPPPADDDASGDVMVVTVRMPRQLKAQLERAVAMLNIRGGEGVARVSINKLCKAAIVDAVAKVDEIAAKGSQPCA